MKNTNGTLGLGEFHLGRVEAIKGSAFLNSVAVEISPRFFIGIHQIDVVQNQFNV
jgi:hypothetical protein